MKSDHEVYLYLNDILCLPEHKRESTSLLRKFCEDKNKLYGTLSCDPHEAAKQMRDGYFIMNAFPTEKIDMNSVVISKEKGFIIRDGEGIIIQCGTEYLSYSPTRIISSLTYTTAKRLLLLSNTCLKNISNRIFDPNTCINFTDLEYDYRRMLMNRYKAAHSI